MGPTALCPIRRKKQWSSVKDTSVAAGDSNPHSAEVSGFLVSETNFHREINVMPIGTCMNSNFRNVKLSH